MDYIVASTTVTDEIRFADGKTVKKVAGGAGIYALCGMKLWCDNVMPATGVGRDYPDLYSEWYRINNISMDGLICKDDKTPYNVIQYFEDGERSETPLYGEDHYRRVEVTPEELMPYFQSAKGIYLFKNSNPVFWDQILDLKKEWGAVIMWEIACDVTNPEHLEEIKGIARHIDVFSINLSEAKNMFGADTLEDVVERFKEWKLRMVFLRQGSKGAVMITPDETVCVPAVKNVDVVDPTGGGNSSSGAVLYGFCSGYSPKKCGLMGSIAAAMCLKQYGVPESIGQEERIRAQEMLRSMESM